MTVGGVDHSLDLLGFHRRLGAILCASRKNETIRLLGLDRGDIRVASELATALPQKQLERKLHAAVTQARARLTAPADSAKTRW